MKTMYRFLGIIIICVVQSACVNSLGHKEKASERIVHIEDSIQYVIPVIPRLCETLDIVKQSVNVGDSNLHVEVEGEGIPIVLINGGPGGTHHSFHPQFSKLKNSHQVIYYDQRGTGQSDFNAGEGYSFKQAVNDLEQLRQQLNIEKWVVCGFSYGGGLAQYYTALYPEHVSGMVLISSLPLFDDTSFVDAQDTFLSTIEKDKKSVIIKEFVSGELSMKPFLYNLALNGDWKRQNYYKPTKEDMLRSALYEWINDDDFNSVMSESYSTYNFKGLFNSCPIPTLIFEGKNDLTWGNKKADIFKANHPNASFIFIEEAAHQLFNDDSEQFFSSLMEFTQSLPSVSSVDLLLWKDSIKNYMSTH